MKNKCLIVVLLLIFVVFNYLILKKEQILGEGQTVLLRLAPVDPRSLMQGDYMILDYEISRNNNVSDDVSKGHMVIKLDENRVASFVRFYDGEVLKKDEYLIFYRNRGGIRLGAESFFFQEGDADIYDNARYGELRVKRTGESVLVGLRNEKFESLGAKRHATLN